MRNVKRRKEFDGKEAALRVYLAVGRCLFKTDDLHLGYWTDDMEVELENLPRAQEKHSEFVVSHIPEGTRTILDVGCGAGRMAERLMKLGYEVDGVSPSAFLAGEARRLLGALRPAQDLDTDQRYDLVLFSESFQYVNMERGLSKCLALLKDGGHLLICDFFDTEARGDMPLKAGHRLSRFRDTITGMPFAPVEDVDITSRTAPNVDLAGGVLRDIARPTWELALERLRIRHPLLTRFLRWKFRKKIERIERCYLGDAISGENLKKSKTYRLMLYRKAANR